MSKFKVCMNNGKEYVITAEDYQIVNLVPPEGRLVFYDSEEREVGRFFIGIEKLDGIIRLDEEDLKKAEQVSFEGRQKVEDAYKGWRNGTGAADCAYNVITYMHSMGWLNGGKINEDITGGRV